MASKISKAKVAAEVGASLAAAAVAGYYFYGSKRAKKHRDVVASELKADWEMMQKELKKLGRVGVQQAKVVQKKVVKKGKKKLRR